VTASKRSQRYRISELAQEFDITTRTIRFYEEKGLLNPDRNGSNRIYSAGDRVKLKLILRGKRLGFTLEQSRDIISMYDSKHGNSDQLNEMLNAIHDKRQHLQQQLHDIEAMMRELHDSEQKCLQALSQQSSGRAN